jgi:septum site-determining protein MinC
MTSATRRQHSLMFRGASFMALVLKPEMPTDRWLAELDQCLSRSPEFFEGKPVVIDVSGLSLTKRKIVALAAELKARGIRILVPLRGTPKMMKSSSRAIPKQCGRNDAGWANDRGFCSGW